MIIPSVAIEYRGVAEDIENEESMVTDGSASRYASKSMPRSEGNVFNASPGVSPPGIPRNFLSITSEKKISVETRRQGKLQLGGSGSGTGRRR